jgi:hypothetical protein
MTHLATLETCAWISAEFGETASATGDFHANFIAHEEPFIVLCNTFLGRFSTVKFLMRNQIPLSPHKLFQDTYHKTIPHSGGN